MGVGIPNGARSYEDYVVYSQLFRERVESDNLVIFDRYGEDMQMLWRRVMSRGIECLRVDDR